MNDFTGVAVLVPCLNEAVVISKVVEQILEVLPGSVVYVYDNNSDDDTANEAMKAGAIVRNEPIRGKGNVVRRMFADIEAEIYVMLDGDGTYEVGAAPAMISLLKTNRLDLVTGSRVDEHPESAAYRRGHRLGNKLFTNSLRRIFSSNCEDVLSGYRVMSRRFVKSFPTVSRGFEIEVEMTAHASLLRVPTGEHRTIYRERPANSFSKLNTYSDGLKIARSLFRIFRSYSPSRFFGTLSLLMSLTSLPFFYQHFWESNSSSNQLIVGLMFASLSTLMLSVGIVLNAISRSRTESLRLVYLSIPFPT
jgi:glycosyltransferase involved in cell wall biosynthesis